jgi:hypothetical protein
LAVHYGKTWTKKSANSEWAWVLGTGQGVFLPVLEFFWKKRFERPVSNAGSRYIPTDVGTLDHRVDSLVFLKKKG